MFLTGLNSDDDPDNFPEDRRLWKGLLKNDRSALSLLFKKYYNPLLNYGLKLIADKELVKDGIQGVFYTLWKKREHLSDVEHVRAYLFTAQRRTVFQLSKQQKARSQRDKYYVEESFLDWIDRETLLARQEFEKEQCKQLADSLDLLSNSQKEVIYLRFYQGLSYEEIADVMQINKQSVYNKTNRAIQALRSLFRITNTR